MTPTIEPSVVIESQALGEIIYQDLKTGERWAVLGECNQCGLCEVGCNDGRVTWVEGKKVGEPGACKDETYAIRPDIVCRPSMAENSIKMAELYEANKPLGTIYGVSWACSLTFLKL